MRSWWIAQGLSRKWFQKKKKRPDRQVAKTSKSSIFWLSFFFSLSSVHRYKTRNLYLCSVQTVSQDSTIKVEAITTIQTRKKSHKSLGTALTTYCDLSTRTILPWISGTPMSILSAIRHFVSLNNIIHSMYAPAPAGSSTEHVISYRERRRQHPRSGGILNIARSGVSPQRSWWGLVLAETRPAQWVTLHNI